MNRKVFLALAIALLSTALPGVLSGARKEAKEVGVSSSGSKRTAKSANLHGSESGEKNGVGGNVASIERGDFEGYGHGSFSDFGNEASSFSSNIHGDYEGSLGSFDQHGLGGYGGHEGYGANQLVDSEFSGYEGQNQYGLHGHGHEIQLQYLGTEVGQHQLPPKVIKIVKTVAIKVPVPYPVQVPHPVPHPVPVPKPYPVHVPKIIKIYEKVPVNFHYGNGGQGGGDYGYTNARASSYSSESGQSYGGGASSSGNEGASSYGYESGYGYGGGFGGSGIGGASSSGNDGSSSYGYDSGHGFGGGFGGSGGASGYGVVDSGHGSDSGYGGDYGIGSGNNNANSGHGIESSGLQQYQGYGNSGSGIDQGHSTLILTKIAELSAAASSRSGAHISPLPAGYMAPKPDKDHQYSSTGAGHK